MLTFYNIESESCSVVSDSMQPHGLYSPWNSPGQDTGRVAVPFSQVSSQPPDWTQVFLIEGGFFTSWATGKPKDTGVGSLSLLQGIFPTPESNQGLLHCRQILYQLSYQGSPWGLFILKKLNIWIKQNSPEIWDHCTLFYEWSSVAWERIEPPPLIHSLSIYNTVVL